MSSLADARESGEQWKKVSSTKGSSWSGSRWRLPADDACPGETSMGRYEHKNSFQGISLSPAAEDDELEETQMNAKKHLESIKVKWQSEINKEKKGRKEARKKEKQSRTVSFLGERRQNGLSNLGAAGYREVEVTVDSGACDIVIPADECEDIQTVESEQSRKGFEYEVANGDTIPNLGEKRCLMMTENSSTPKRINFQVADVHKPLLAVSKVADMGFECRLGKNGGCLLDIVTQEAIPIRRKGNLYTMKVWVKDAGPPFTRRG